MLHLQFRETPNTSWVDVESDIGTQEQAAEVMAQLNSHYDYEKYRFKPKEHQL